MTAAVPHARAAATTGCRHYPEAVFTRDEVRLTTLSSCAG